MLSEGQKCPRGTENSIKYIQFFPFNAPFKQHLWTCVLGCDIEEGVTKRNPLKKLAQEVFAPLDAEELFGAIISLFYTIQ